LKLISTAMALDEVMTAARAALATQRHTLNLH
jgi:hypothetical protein